MEISSPGARTLILSIKARWLFRRDPHPGHTIQKKETGNPSRDLLKGMVTFVSPPVACATYGTHYMIKARIKPING